MSKASVIVLAAICVLVLAITIPHFIHVRPTRAALGCISSLRVIDAAEKEWALEYHKTTNDMPTWDDLRPYCWSNRIPVCPDGGTYTLGRVGQLPVCSLGDKEPSYKL